MSGGTIPNIRYLNSYDHFTYDTVTISRMFDFVLIRGQKGIVNSQIADLVVEGGSIFNEGIKIGQAKVGGTDLVYIGSEDHPLDKKYPKEYAGTMSYNIGGNEPNSHDRLLVVNRHGYTIDLLNPSDAGDFDGPVNLNGYCIYNVGCIEMDLTGPSDPLPPGSDAYLHDIRGRIYNLRGPRTSDASGSDYGLLDAVNRKYVDNEIVAYGSDASNIFVEKKGDSMTGQLKMIDSDIKITDLGSITMERGDFAMGDGNFNKIGGHINTENTIYGLVQGEFNTHNTNFDLTSGQFKMQATAIILEGGTVTVPHGFSVIFTINDSTINTSLTNINMDGNGVSVFNINKYHHFNINNTNISTSDTNFDLKGGEFNTNSTNFNLTGGEFKTSGTNFDLDTGSCSITSFTFNTMNNIFNSQSDTYTISDSIISFGSSADGTGVSGTTVQNLKLPVDPADAVNKNYVDKAVAQISGGLGVGLQPGLIMMWPTTSIIPQTIVGASDVNSGAVEGSFYWLPCDGTAISASDYPALKPVLPIDIGDPTHLVLPKLNQYLPIGSGQLGGAAHVYSGPSDGIPSDTVTADPITLIKENLPSVQISVNGSTNEAPNVSVSGTIDTSSLKVSENNLQNHIELHIPEQTTVSGGATNVNGTGPDVTISGSGYVDLHNPGHHHKTQFHQANVGGTVPQKAPIDWTDATPAGTSKYETSEPNPDPLGASWEPKIRVDEVADKLNNIGSNDIASALEVTVGQLTISDQPNVGNLVVNSDIGLTGSATPNLKVDIPSLTVSDALTVSLGSDQPTSDTITNFRDDIIPTIALQYIIFASRINTTST